MDSWQDLTWRERRKRRRAVEAELRKLLDSCKNEKDCLFIGLKYAMMAIQYPKDCPSREEILERLAAQLLPSTDERDLEFILTLFPELKAANAAEAQLATLKCPG